MLPRWILWFSLALASGCAWLQATEDETKGWSADKLYSEAHKALQSGDYETAIQYFETLETRYPFGRYAQQALLEAAYAYYKFDEPDAAIAALDRFIRLYPRHPHVDYAYYLKGLVNFNRGMGLIERFLPMDPSKRDPRTSVQAFRAFEELVRRFPESRYAEDARQRMVHLRNNLAWHEVHVARYYMRREAYLAAVNRAKYTIEHYPGAPAVPEALAIMVRAYAILGLDDLSKDAMKVLERSYPDHPALKELRS